MNAPAKMLPSVEASKSPQPDRAMLRQVLQLALPFGKLRLLSVFLLVMMQGVFQVIGVTSIFPFLALAADPQRIYNSQYGLWFLSFLPEMGNAQLLMIAGVFSVGMMLLANFFCIVGEYTRNKYAHDYGHWLRVHLLNRIVEQPYSYFLQNNSSVLFKKVYGDVQGYVNQVLLPMLEAVAKSVTCLLLVFTLLFVHLKIALAATTVLTVFYLLIYLTLKKQRQQISFEMKDAMRTSARSLNQLFGGIKPIKVHEVEESFVREFAEPSRKSADYGAWIPIYANIPRHVVEPIAFGGMIAIVVYLNMQGRNMAAILPNMGVMALAGYKLMPAVQIVYGQLTKIATGRHFLEEVHDEFAGDRHLSESDKTAAFAAPLNWCRSIKLADVSFAYPESSEPVVCDLNLEIKKNTSVAFVGKTGSGKSTIIDLIMGLHRPQFGHLQVDGQTIDSNNIGSFRATIGYVPQEVFLTDDTIAANIALGIKGNDVDEDRLRLAATTAQILDFIENDLTDGFETKVGERGVRLSGGQRQRIGLARALYREPSILVFDEATSALDNETEADLMNSIELLGGEMTIIMVAHRLSTVKNCDQIFQLDNGEIHSMQFQELVAE